MNDKLFKSIALGQEAEKFITSELGKHIQNKAIEQVEAAKDALADIDPTNVKEITRLQNIIARFDNFGRWINEVISAGDFAYEQYKNDGEN